MSPSQRMMRGRGDQVSQGHYSKLVSWIARKTQPGFLGAGWSEGQDAPDHESSRPNKDCSAGFFRFPAPILSLRARKSSGEREAMNQHRSGTFLLLALCCFV
jgi:hypothetical protein